MTPKEIATKLYTDIPLVPTGCLIQSIVQDIQLGLYRDCGDPNKNWKKWKEKCKQLLNQRGILSNNRRLKKLSYHDEDCRNFAIVYIGDKFYSGSSHNEALEKYLSDNSIDRNYSHEDSKSRENVDMELKNNENLDQLPFACMHQIHKDMFNEALDKYMNGNDFINFNTYRNRITKNRRQGAIFLEIETVNNIDLNQLIEAIQKEFPGYEIYAEDIKYEPFEYERYEKIAKLKRKAFHDTSDRECAIIYVDGQFFEGRTHNEALTEFTNFMALNRRYNGGTPNRDYLEFEIKKNRKLKDLPFCCLNKVTENLITGEKVKYIYIEGYSATNTTIDEIVNAVEKAYPEFDIFLDDYNTHPLEYEKFEKLN